MSRAAWMAGKWGVMVHYLDETPSAGTPSTTSAAEWNRRIDAFDVPLFSGQIAGTGAAYVLFTVGQNSGHYCSPNAAYDRLTGLAPGKCSRRDLIAEIAEALARHGIRLLAYVPSGAPAADREAAARLKWRWGLHEPWPGGGNATGERLAEFQRNWEEIVEEWSRRWGRLVSGWWIDGCYFADAMYRHPEAPNFSSFAAALRAGNPHSALAFNPGVRVPIASMTEEEDYTAGELSGALPLGTFDEGCDWKPVPFRSPVGKAQLHALCYLGEWWGSGMPRLPTPLVSGFTRLIQDRGGAVTWEVPIRENGELPPPFLDQLRELRIQPSPGRKRHRHPNSTH